MSRVLGFVVKFVSGSTHCKNTQTFFSRGQSQRVVGGLDGSKEFWNVPFVFGTTKSVDFIWTHIGDSALEHQGQGPVNQESTAQTAQQSQSHFLSENMNQWVMIFCEWRNPTRFYTSPKHLYSVSNISSRRIPDLSNCDNCKTFEHQESCSRSHFPEDA